MRMIVSAVARMFDPGEFLLVVVARVAAHLRIGVALRYQPRSDAGGHFDDTVALEMVEAYAVHLTFLRHYFDANLHLLLS